MTKEMLARFAKFRVLDDHPYTHHTQKGQGNEPTDMYPIIDIRSLPETKEIDLADAFEKLAKQYQELDTCIEVTTSFLDLPCKKGCSDCCHESVFLTPLEFFYVWDWVQKEIPTEIRENMIERGLAIYEENRDLIEAFELPPPDGERDHFSIAERLKFTCPFLDGLGRCQVYPVREIFARLFGCSFDDGNGVYGCELVQEHLLGKRVSLLPARGMARYLHKLPLTEKRQVYPYYIHRLFGEKN